MCPYRAALAGLSILLLLFLSSLEPLSYTNKNPKRPSISILPYQQLLKSLVLRSAPLHEDRLELLASDEGSEKNCEDDLQSMKLERLYEAIEKVNTSFGFKGISKILDFDDNGSLFRIFAKFEMKNTQGKVEGVLEQSFVVKGDEYSSRIEHVCLPQGKQMSKPIISKSIEAMRGLSKNPKNRIELEAASGKRLIGAYVWAKRGFSFLPGELDSLKDQLFRYIGALYPLEPKERILNWINQQNLEVPEDFVSLPSYEALRNKGYKSVLEFLNPKSKRLRYFAKLQAKFGLAFLLDPMVAARWEGEIRVGDV